MEFLSQMGRIIVGAMDSALVYNRKKALHKRLKHMIQRENRQVNLKYLLLGKYCYKNLQNSISDESVKKICQSIQISQERMTKARKRLVALQSRSLEQDQILSETSKKENESENLKQIYNHL